LVDLTVDEQREPVSKGMSSRVLLHHSLQAIEGLARIRGITGKPQAAQHQGFRRRSTVPAAKGSPATLCHPA